MNQHLDPAILSTAHIAEVRPSNLTKVGFFHFVQSYEEPIPALTDAFRNTQERYGQDVTHDALIVLPEAFNIRKRYDHQTPPNVDPAILNDLAQMSNGFRCAFLAGLIIRDAPGVDPPYSSAYLIDGFTEPQLLCRKVGRDDFEVSRAHCFGSIANYTACAEQRCRPIQHRGIAIVAVLCMDARYEESTDLTPERFTDRCVRIVQDLRRLDGPNEVVCVPACMSNGFCSGVPGKNVTKETPWEGTILVLANRRLDVNSFVSDAKGVILESPGRLDENGIEIRSLESCSVAIERRS
jgi:hypothetical protein